MENKTDNNLKGKITGIFGYFKHLVKDPVKTVPEAKARKKEVQKILLISLGLSLGGMILDSLVLRKLLGTSSAYGVISTILKIPTAIGFIGVIFSGFLLVIVGKVLNNLKDLECPNCKEQITDTDSVKYSILRQWEERKVDSSSNNIHVTQTVKALVSISCVCQNCGTEKTFKKEFITARFYDGTLKSSNVS